MIISICICTFNRCEILAHCLDSIAKLNDPRPTDDIEIVVVDNNSRDETRTLVEKLIPHFPFKMRYVLEGEQGISAARNRAIDEAVGDYLAFLDDECIVSPDWLSIAIADINRFRPSIIGGPFFGAFLPGDRPKWFKVEYGDASQFINVQYPKGFNGEFRACAGNMFVRRDVFESVRFDVAMGQKGYQLKVGEEIDLQDRFLRSHGSERIFFDPGLIVRHFIRPEKMRLSYHAKRAILTTLGSPSIIDHETFLVALSKALGHAALSPITCIWRNREQYPFWQNFIYERVIPATCFRAGTVAKYLRDRFCSAEQTKSFTR